MINYPRAVYFQGATHVGTWKNTSIPIYDVPTMHSLNQLVGYIKHINAGNGTVLYRGQNQLYEKVCPSIQHDPSKLDYNLKKLYASIEGILKDDPCLHLFGFRNEEVQGWLLYEKLIIEAALQHYGASTFCVDFVDNHWTALWFGLYRWDKAKKCYICRKKTDIIPDKDFITYDADYCKIEYNSEPLLEEVILSDEKLGELRKHASHGTVSFEELEERYKRSRLRGLHLAWEKEKAKINEHNSKIEEMEKASHVYLFLYVADTNAPCVHGLYMGKETYTIDLRKSLPSTFMRPSSQHGWIVRGKDNNFEFNSNIACVIRLNTELVKRMLGEGLLLSQENFFPRETVDQGYRVLLERQKDSRLNGKFAKIISEDMIVDFG